MEGDDAEEEEEEAQLPAVRLEFVAAVSFMFIYILLKYIIQFFLNI